MDNRTFCDVCLVKAAWFVLRKECTMGLLGKLLFKPASVQGAAQTINDARMSRIKAVEQSGLIRFVPREDLPFTDGDLPITFFSLPDNPKKRQLIYETAVKNVKKEKIPMLAEGNLLFVIADSVFGNATCGLLATSEGIFVGDLFHSYVSRENIDSFGTDKSQLYIKAKDGKKYYPAVMTSKKMREREADFLTLFRHLYC